MNASLLWHIVITCAGNEMGDPIEAHGWDVHSKLAAVKKTIPNGWSAEAYPQI